MQPPQTATTLPATPIATTTRGRIRLAAATLAAFTLLSACSQPGGDNIDAVILTTTSGPATIPSAVTVPPPVTVTTTLPATTPPTAPPVVSTVPPETTAVTTTTTIAASAVPVNYATPAAPQAAPTVPKNPNAKGTAPVIGTIRIPKINVNMSLYDGVTNPVLDLGPGHWPGTAWPGQVGNVVIGGHRTSKHAVFRRVDELKAGDQILIDDSNGTHTYAVSRIQVVQPEDVWIADPTQTATITLFACHPPGKTTQRLVVFGDLVS